MGSFGIRPNQSKLYSLSPTDQPHLAILRHRCFHGLPRKRYELVFLSPFELTKPVLMRGQHKWILSNHQHCLHLAGIISKWYRYHGGLCSGLLWRCLRAGSKKNVQLHFQHRLRVLDDDFPVQRVCSRRLFLRMARPSNDQGRLPFDNRKSRLHRLISLYHAYNQCLRSLDWCAVGIQHCHICGDPNCSQDLWYERDKFWRKPQNQPWSDRSDHDPKRTTHNIHLSKLYTGHAWGLGPLPLVVGYVQ